MIKADANTSVSSLQHYLGGLTTLGLDTLYRSSDLTRWAIRPHLSNIHSRLVHQRDRCVHDMRMCPKVAASHQVHLRAAWTMSASRTAVEMRLYWAARLRLSILALPQRSVSIAPSGNRLKRRGRVADKKGIGSLVSWQRQRRTAKTAMPGHARIVCAGHVSPRPGLRSSPCSTRVNQSHVS